jgi:hypothetical protein
MKRVSLFLLVTMLATSCNSIAAPAATATSQPTATATFIPSPTLMPTLTPTATPDPMANAPKGTTGVDKKGNFIKEKDGRTYVWVEETFTMIGGEPVEMKDWFEARTIGTKNGKLGDPVYLIPREATPGIDRSIVPMYVYAQEGQPPFADNSVVYANDITPLTYDQKLLAFPNFLLADRLWKLYMKANNIGASSGTLFLQEVNAGNYSLPLEGLPAWKPSPKVGYKVLVVGKNTLVDGLPVSSENPKVTKWKGVWGLYFYTIVAMDNDGNLVQIVASDKSLDTLDDKQIRIMFLVALLNVVTVPDFKIENFDHLADTQDRAIDVAGSFTWGDKSTPFIAIEPVP